MSSDVLFIATMSCVFFLLISGYFFLALVFLSFRRSIPDFFFSFHDFHSHPFFLISGDRFCLAANLETGTYRVLDAG